MVQSTKTSDVDVVDDKPSTVAASNSSKLPTKSLSKTKNHQHANVDVQTIPTKSATTQSSASSSSIPSASSKQNGPISVAVQQNAQQNNVVVTQDKNSKTTIEQNGLPSDAAGTQLSANGSMLNGNASSNNGRRTSKQKWVPLAIDIAKTRSSRYKRRDGDHDDDYYTEVNMNRARRYRPTTYRGGKSSSSMGRGGGASSSVGGRRQISSGGSGSGGGTGAKVIRRTRNHPDYMDYPSEFSLVNKRTAAAAASIPPYMMPYLGTFYYNGVPSYANMDAVTLKDAIKKQM